LFKQEVVFWIRPIAADSTGLPIAADPRPAERVLRPRGEFNRSELFRSENERGVLGLTLTLLVRRLPYRLFVPFSARRAQIASPTMITLRLYLETIAGDWFGWIEGFPGAYARGVTANEVERSAPRAFSEYLLWLRLNGEDIPDGLSGLTSADFTPKIEHILTDSAAAACDARHCMESDLGPFERADFERCLRLLRYSRTDLVDAAGAIPPHEWDTAPPGAQSIRSALSRHGHMEISMLSRLGIEPTIRTHPDPVTSLARIRATFESAVCDLFDRGDCSSKRSDESAWPLPKVLRMAIWHEQITTRQILVRTNPRAYLRSVAGTEAVVRHRNAPERSDGLTADSEESAPAARHTQSSGYYY
jgi:hypothetical protein